MRAILATLILISGLVEFVRGDDNIYGPSGVNLGPNGDPRQLFLEIEQQRRRQEQQDQRQRRQLQEAISDYESGPGLILRQQYNGHYFVDAAINNVPLVFAIDTGASLVTLPERVASSAGIKCEAVTFMETVNGRAKACTCVIAMLKLGDFSMTDVKCVIAPNLSQALLGNNVLSRFKIRQHNGEMRITK